MDPLYFKIIFKFSMGQFKVPEPMWTMAILDILRNFSIEMIFAMNNWNTTLEMAFIKISKHSISSNIGEFLRNSY